MNLHELHRILGTIGRRFKDPQRNPMTLREMTRFYILKKIYLHRRRLPAIEVPFDFHQGESARPPGIAVVVQCYYLDLMDEMLSHIQQIPFPYQLYVSTDTPEKCAEIRRKIDDYQIAGAEVRLAPNRGRDIAPKYITFRDVYAKCDYFLHLHSKKSPHTGVWGDQWRRHLLHTLSGSPEIVRSNLRLLDDSRLGMVFPVCLDDTVPALRWGDNFVVSSQLADRLKVEISPDYCMDYPAGGMFWAKSAAIKPLLDLNLTFEDFQAESGQLDGCLNHAIERLVRHSALKQGLHGCRVGASSAYPHLLRVVDDNTLSSAVSTCLHAQEQERLRYDKPARKSPQQNGL